MKNVFIREKLPDDAIVLDDESFDDSIIGLTFDGRVIYSFSQMIAEYMYNNDCTEEEALDWIEYNTIRAIPYMPSPRPLIVDELT